MINRSKPDTYKIVVVGNPTVGKTSIVRRKVCGNFGTDIPTTIGCCFNRIFVDDIYIDIWDTAGQERFSSMTKGYFNNVVVYLLVYNVTDHENNNGIDKWLNSIRDGHRGDEYRIIFVGNKIDLLNNKNNLPTISNKYDLDPIIYTSAKNDIGIEELFHEVATKCKLLNKINKNKTNKELIVVDNKIDLEEKPLGWHEWLSSWKCW